MKEAKGSTISSNNVGQEDQVTYSWENLCVTLYPQPIVRLFQSKRKNEEATKRIITNVSGIAHTGEIMAMMGSSGAGKSTLLNALTFRTSRKLLTTGDIRVNGIPAEARLMSFISAYVQQDDVFLGNLTVSEQMHFAAKVTMPKGTKKKQRNERIDDLMNDLNLVKCAHTRIGIPGKTKGISGGERKRLAFATGLLNNPPMLLCDEPTSGLDSFMSKSVIMMLKRLSTQGRTIIATIHQPSSEVYYLFDKVTNDLRSPFILENVRNKPQVKFTITGEVMVATLNASCIISIGAPCPAGFNPADYYITRLATKYEDPEPGAAPQDEFLAKIINTYENSKWRKELTKEIALTIRSLQSVRSRLLSGSLSEKKSESENLEFLSLEKSARLSERVTVLSKRRYQQNALVQFRALFARSVRDTIKSKELFSWKLGQTVVVALLFGMLYWKQENNQDSVLSINGAIFISVMNLCLQNVFAVIHVFIDELPVLIREHYDGMYTVDAYFISKTLVEIPLHILCPFVYVSIMYYMVNFNQQVDRYLWHALIFVFLALIGASFGYFIGTLTSNLALALNASIPILIPLILFSGYMLNIDTMPRYLSWLPYTSWFYYANEALLIVQWDGVKHIDCTRQFTTCPANGTVVLGMFAYKPKNFQFDVIMLAVFFVGFRILGLGLLHLRVMLKD